MLTLQPTDNSTDFYQPLDLGASSDIAFLHGLAEGETSGKVPGLCVNSGLGVQSCREALGTDGLSVMPGKSLRVAPSEGTAPRDPNTLLRES